MSADRQGWDATDGRDNDLLARLMLDSVLPHEISDGQAIAMGVGYSNLTLAASMDRHAEALELWAAALNSTLAEARQAKDDTDERS